MMFDVVSLQGLEGKKVWMESSSLNDGATTNYQINDYFLPAIKSWSFSFHVQVEFDFLDLLDRQIYITFYLLYLTVRSIVKY